MKKIKLMIVCGVFCLFSCSGGYDDAIKNLGGSTPLINTFSISEPVTNLMMSGVISGNSINVALPEGSALTNLVATFTITGIEARIGSTVQVSGITANNFTTSRIYTVYHIDGSTKNYTVSVRNKGWTAKTSGLPGSNVFWSSITSSADGTKLAAAIASFGDGIYVSSNSGTSWTHRTSISGISRSIASSTDGNYLAIAAGWGDMDPDDVYTSSDSGASWTTHSSVFGGANEWSSIASSSSGWYLTAAQGMNTDGDGNIYNGEFDGDSWSWWLSGAPIRNWTGVASSYNGLKLVAVADAGNIYTSTDGGANWTLRNSVRSWSSVASSSDGTVLWATVYGGQIYKSTNSGVSWTSMGTNQNWKSIACSADGNVVAVAIDGGLIWSSIDGGANWISHASGGNHNWRSVTMSADGSKFAAVFNNDRYVYIYE